MISAAGYEQLVTHIFAEGSPYLESDAVFGVKSSLIQVFETKQPGAAPDGRVLINPGDTWLGDLASKPQAHPDCRRPAEHEVSHVAGEGVIGCNDQIIIGFEGDNPVTAEANKLVVESFVEFINTASEALAAELISPDAINFLCTHALGANARAGWLPFDHPDDAGRLPRYPMDPGGNGR